MHGESADSDTDTKKPNKQTKKCKDSDSGNKSKHNLEEQITMAAPYLLTLVNGNKKKWRELEALLTEMQMIIRQVCSEDASHLKPVIGQYAAYDPDDQDLDPPIHANNQRSCVKMGINRAPSVTNPVLYGSPDLHNIPCNIGQWIMGR
ncbi:hypothetical protein BDR03DRAFT_985602 [Suillus americanus]|nr:hypothetical protein BDR03DRAFT_985602 [Suillus americanus]